MVGDSMAFDEWPAVAAAMYARQDRHRRLRLARGRAARHQVRLAAEIDKMVADFKPDLVLYQGSLWDFGTPTSNVSPTSASPTT